MANRIINEVPRGQPCRLRHHVEAARHHRVGVRRVGRRSAAAVSAAAPIVGRSEQEPAERSGGWRRRLSRPPAARPRSPTRACSKRRPSSSVARAHGVASPATCSRSCWYSAGAPRGRGAARWPGACRSPAPVWAPKNSFRRPRSRMIGRVDGRLGQPRGQGAPPAGADAVGRAPSAAGFGRLGQQAGFGQPVRLGVELAVGEGPEVADGLRHLLLHLVGGDRSMLGDEAEHDVGGRRQVDRRGHRRIVRFGSMAGWALRRARRLPSPPCCRGSTRNGLGRGWPIT